MLLFECLQVSPLSVFDICHGTDHDPLLAKVQTFVLQGWPMHLEGEEFQPLVRRKDELAVSNHVLLWSTRVVVPPKAQRELLMWFIIHTLVLVV